MLKEGQKAPQFSLKDQNGKIHKLTDYRGKKVVLYFYPKDDTPGCTKEACSFRDDYSLISKKGAVILGVSADDTDSHGKFAKKYSLPFPLLSDPEKTIIKEYNAWGEKNLYGKVFFGIIRSTFIIDEKGALKKIFLKVKPEVHSKEVLAAL